MSNAPNYRIVERYGQVHIQEQKGFLGIHWWSTLKFFYPEGREEYIDYRTVTEAKAAIDRARAAYVRVYETPHAITNYPA